MDHLYHRPPLLTYQSHCMTHGGHNLQSPAFRAWLNHRFDPTASSPLQLKYPLKVFQCFHATSLSLSFFSFSNSYFIQKIYMRNNYCLKDKTPSPCKKLINTQLFVCLFVFSEFLFVLLLFFVRITILVLQK